MDAYIHGVFVSLNVQNTNVGFVYAPHSTPPPSVDAFQSRCDSQSEHHPPYTLTTSARHQCPKHLSRDMASSPQNRLHRHLNQGHCTSQPEFHSPFRSEQISNAVIWLLTGTQCPLSNQLQARPPIFCATPNVGPSIQKSSCICMQLTLVSVHWVVQHRGERRLGPVHPRVVFDDCLTLRFSVSWQYTKMAY